MLASALLLAIGAAGPSQDGLAAVRAVLQRGPEGDPTCPEEVLVRRLTALGTGAAPTLFAVYAGEATEELHGQAADDAWLCPPDRFPSLAFEALANLPGEPVRESLRLAVAARPERELRTCAVDVVGRQATSEGLELLLGWIVEGESDLASRSFSDPARTALAAILRADLRSVHMLEKHLPELSTTVQGLAYEALGRSGRPQAMALLMRLAGKVPELDLTVLDAITRLAAEHPWRLTQDVGAYLRLGLDGEDPLLRAAAARSIGELRESGAIAALVQRLGDGDPRVQRAVRWALERTTGLDLATRDEWQAWLDGEREWWLEIGRPRVDALQGGDLRGLSSMMRDALRHPLGRTRTAEALIEALPHLEGEGRAVVCTTLAQLGARNAVPALVELLFESDLRVREAAHAALRVLTGEDLPAEPRMWERFAFS